MNLHFSFTLFGTKHILNYRAHKDFNKFHVGITNKCKDGRYVLFLDYDDVPFEWVIEELKHLAKKYGLHKTYIFKTKHGYHAVNTEKFMLTGLLKIMRDTSIDRNYLNVPLKRAKRVWTLRQSAKEGEQEIKHVMTINGNTLRNRERSKAHNEYMRKVYKIPCPSINEDDAETLIKAYYHITE